MKNIDYIIPLAWPEAMVQSTGGWYDFVTNTLGIAKNGKYRAGHSAVLLVNSKNGKVFYFDYGRYHTPIGFGRVRDEKTDHELKITNVAACNNGTIKNIKAILLEIANNKSNHGEGQMYASILSGVYFEKGYEYAKKMQKKGTIPYGPFIKIGTNCSRFVASVMKVASPSLIKILRLKYPFCISPSPKRNVRIANQSYYIINKNDCEIVNRNAILGYLKSIEK